MKTRFLIAALLMLFGLSAMAQTTTVTKTFYQCPMHPQVQKSKPGDCPICGMTLEKKTVKVKVAAPKPKPQQAKPATHDHAGMEGMDMPMGKPDTSGGKPLRDVTEHLEHAATAPSKIGIIKAGPPHKVRYDLYIGDSLVNFTGGKKMHHAIVVNGALPAPALYFNQGDTAEIWLHNRLKVSTSVHWHGLILPNQYDGVPYLTTAPIKPGMSHLFTFPLVQNGTYWYHSHSNTQEQDGLYGAFIINKREEPDYKQLPIVLSDWTNMASREVDRSLHNQTDWFGIRKATIQSYAEAIENGAFKTKVKNEWKRMLAMDVSDVYYDRFLINGSSDAEMPAFKPGDKVRLRIVNGGSSSYFWLTWAGGKMTIVANDGEDVVPVEVDRLIIAAAETYDVIVTIPADKHSYECLATPEDRTKSASLWLGSGSKVIAPHLQKLKYFEGMKMMNGMMKMDGNLDPGSMGNMQMRDQVMDMNTVMYPEITGGGEGKYGNTVNEGDGQEDDSQSDVTSGDNQSGHDLKGVMDMKGMNMGMAHMDNKPADSTGMDGNGMSGMNDMKGGYVNGNWQDMNSGESGIKTLNYSMLRAPEKTTLPDWPMRTLYFELTGNMNHYVWTINNKTVSESDVIKIKRGENIRIVMYNNTMMRHPMHLHGHFFRVLNGQGDYAPLKNTLDIMPMERDTIEFAGTESGDWFFHCHILYHMMSGMGRIFSYENSPPNPEIPNPRYARRKLYNDDREFHFMTKIGVETNGSDGEAMFANTRWKLETMWHLGTMPHHGYESETMVGRYLGKMQWWYPYVGFDFHRKKIAMGGEQGPENIFGNDEFNLFGQESNKNHRQTIVAGLRYTLPMLVEADMRIDGNGKLRFQLSREDVPITSHLRFNFMLNTDKEYMAGFRYILTKYISLSSHYDSDMGLGAGLTITY